MMEREGEIINLTLGSLLARMEEGEEGTVVLSPLWFWFEIFQDYKIDTGTFPPVCTKFTQPHFPAWPLMYRDRQKGVAVCKATARQSQEED